MSEAHQPSMPRVLWLERDRAPAPVLPPPAPARELPQLFRPKSPVRERLFPSARPIAQAIRRVSDGDRVRLVYLLPCVQICMEAPPPASERETLPASLIITVVAAHYDVEAADILARRGRPEVALPRQVAMYLARTLTGRSLPKIGRDFGGRDHSTILSGVRKVTALMRRDPHLIAAVAALAARLKSYQS